MLKTIYEQHLCSWKETSKKFKYFSNILDASCEIFLKYNDIISYVNLNLIFWVPNQISLISNTKYYWSGAINDITE